MGSRSRFSIFAGFALYAAAGARAQMHHVDAPQKVTRAIGVYEWTGDLTKPSAARFVPVSLFIDGHFEDAGLYLARPVPFALQTGNLYTVERSGEPEGALALQQAARVVSGNALADDNPEGAWYGFGTFTAESAPKAGPALHKTAHVGSIQSSSGSTKADKTTADTDDGKPHMSRRTPATGGDSTGQTSGSGSGSGSTSGSGSGSGSSSGSSNGGDDTDRPTLARRDPSQDASRKRTAVGGKKGTASVTAVGPAPGDDPDRPTLTHNSKADSGVQELTGMPADLHQAVAVSDPVTRDPHPFARAWEDAAERATTLTALEALAKPRVAAYLTENHLVPSTAMVIPATPAPAAQSSEGVAANTENGAGAPPKLQRGKPTEYGTAGSAAAPAKPQPKPPAQASHTAGHSASRAKTAGKAAPPPPLLLQAEDIHGFTLSYGGLPTFVYTASTPAAASEAKDLPPSATHPTVFVTLVAQRLPSGELQVALGAVTDSLHLDRSPRLHLIDAVDPDASHRASLLFELRGTGSRQFALYRLITAKAENTFTSASIE